MKLRWGLVVAVVVSSLAGAGTGTAVSAPGPAPTAQGSLDQVRELIGPPVAPAALRAAVREGRRARAERSRQALFAAPVRPGALAGRRIALSAGHGRFFRWTYDSGAPAEYWDWQRGVTQSLREDLHTNQLVLEFLTPLLERAGAEVVSLRERSYPTPELRLDNDGGGDGAYDESGTWETSATPGHAGGTYRFAYGAPRGTAEARWSFTVPAAGDYPVYVWFLASANRSHAARYRVEHAHGTATRLLDQGALRVETFDPPGYPNVPPPSDTPGELNGRWHYLGTFPFTPDAPGAVVLSNEGSDPEAVVIADAVRVGADESGVAYLGETSGVPRWQEAALVFLEAAGAPEWVRVNDVVTRPLYAIYEGVDAYFAFHTNCCESSGTSIWTWYPEMWVGESSWPADFVADELPPGTYEWSDRILDGIVRAVRTNWDPSWRDAGHWGADFGELRPIRYAWRTDLDEGIDPPLAIPAALVEAAYHDTAADAQLIREQNWRFDVARGIANGMVRYFAGDEQALVPPLAPAAVAAWSTPTGLRVAWRPAPDPVEPDAVPSGYRLYVSADPLVFPEVATLETAATAVELDVAPCEALYVRVAAANAAGESLPGPVVGARRTPASDGAGTPVFLWVNGVDREVRTEADPTSPREYARWWGPALAAAGGRDAGFFAMATDDAVGEGLVRLGDFAAVAWSTGETSRHDGSIGAAERAAVEAWLAAGDARLALSGAEIGWDLIDAPSGDSARFLPEVLHVEYLSDDADDATVDGVPGGPFEDFAGLDFGACDSDSYCVEWPDVLAAQDGGDVVLTYAGTGEGAAVEEYGVGRHVLVFGFPLETVADPARRRDLLVAVAETLLPEWVGAEPDCSPPPPEPGPEPVAEPVAEPAADVAGGEDVAARPDTGPGPDLSGPDDGGAATDQAGPGGPDVPKPVVDVFVPRRDVAGADRLAVDGAPGADDGAGGGGGGGGSSSCAAAPSVPAGGPGALALLALGVCLAGARHGRRRAPRSPGP